MEEKLKSLNILAQNKLKENKAFFKQLGKKQKRLIDKEFHLAHDEVFSRIDCLECANCCKTLGPGLNDKDVERISKALKIKPKEVINKYLKMDEDGDLVFKSMPCPFLLSDNFCMIYESRPKACREYPHTDRINILQIKDITLKNSFSCPAVFDILEIIKEKH